MKAPKLLPWYARKAGVPIERAEHLWRKAVRIATERTGWVGTSEYWGEAIDAFLSLLSNEKGSLCSPQVTPFLRSQSRIWRLPLNAMEDVCVAMASHWQKQLTGQPPSRAA